MHLMYLTNSNDNMSEFISKHCTDKQAKQIIAAAGVHRLTLLRWKQKKTSPTTHTCILICRAISKKQNKSFEQLIFECIQSVAIYT